MNNNDTVSISRAASTRSRSSKRGSTISRSQSLVKRQIQGGNDLKPSDVLIERFVAWKTIVKQLIAYFEGVADIENNTAKELTKLGAVIQVPFRSGNQFMGEGGLQDVFYGIRDKTRIIADQHANLGRTVDSSIVQHLQKLRTEIKAHIKNIQNDTGRLATSVAKERELSSKLISELSTNISVFKNTPLHVTSKSDPYIANAAVSRQLAKQVHEENALQKSIIIMQQNSAHFEEGIVRAIQSAWQTFDEWQSRMSTAVQETWQALGGHMASMQPDQEWIAFSARSDHLLDPETPLRNPEHINYPSKEDPAVLPVHTGYIERKKRFTRSYRESYYVLTAAGFLHEFTSSDPAAGTSPTFSLFLPLCTLGPASAVNAKSHKFHIEGGRDGQGTTKSGSIRQKMGMKSSAHAWSFRARSHDEMMEWWNDIRMLCARYLVASEHMERAGPVHAAVRAAGYETEEGETDDEGSSVEEDDGEGEDEDDEEAMYEEARDAAPDETLPSYSNHGHGENGYTNEKKGGIPGSLPDDGAGAGEDRVSRRPSKRQQEKAPEGREPRVDEDGAGPAEVEAAAGGDQPQVRSSSRFREDL